jgi:hypothetical protein
MGCPKERYDSVGLTLGQEPGDDGSAQAAEFLRSRGEPFKSEEERRRLYMHAAMLLEACDFPCEVLKGSVFTKAGWDAEDNAAVTDLLTTYVDARYFAELAACAGNGLPLPVHPFDRYTLAAFLEPVSVEALRNGSPKMLMPIQSSLRRCWIASDWAGRAGHL